jgi:hypothetical protein
MSVDARQRRFKEAAKRLAGRWRSPEFVALALTDPEAGTAEMNQGVAELVAEFPDMLPSDFEPPQVEWYRLPIRPE